MASQIQTWSVARHGHCCPLSSHGNPICRFRVAFAAPQTKTKHKHIVKIILTMTSLKPQASDSVSSHEAEDERQTSPKPGKSHSLNSDKRPEDNAPQDTSQGNAKVTEESVSEGLGSVVAQHYNNRSETGLTERFQSRIFYMRNTNNWVKSMIIGEILDKIRDCSSHGHRIKVLDLACGKGGDLIKWQKGNIDHLVCADIAEASVQTCQERYASLNQREGGRGRGWSRDKVFTAEFITEDCTKGRLKPKLKDPSINLDLVSCQFAFHYSFESLPQAEQMLQNATENLRMGGYFIGTTPDSYDIMRRLNREENPGNRKFGNSLFSVEFDESVDLDHPPLFGARYNFHLEEVVDCPEFLVHFPTLEKLAAKYGLRLVKKERFEDFVDRHREDGKGLMNRMQALETYPPYEGERLLGEVDDYAHAKEYIAQRDADRDQPWKKIGTLSKQEWEAASLYLVFVFQKVNQPELSPTKRSRDDREEEEAEETETKRSKRN